MSVGVLAAAMQAAVSGAGGGGGGGDIYWPQVSLSLPLTADFSDAAGGGGFTATGASITGGGAVCDGVNDIFRRAAGIAWAFGRSDYTVEGFLKQNGAGSVQCFFDTRSGSKEGVALYLKSGFGAGGITFGTATALVAGTATEFSTSVRQHWALVREGTTTRFYLDGVQLFTYTDTRLIVGSGTCTFGDNYLGPASQPAACDQNHIRITRGVCRYPGGTTFTPPTGPFDTGGGTDPGTGPGAHRYWRLLITASESASFHGMTELKFLDRDGVIVSGYNAGVTNSISASSSINGGNIDYLAFDMDPGTGWLSATAGTEWIKQDMQHSDQVIGVPVEIKDVHIYGSWNSPTSSPKDFKLQWSDDNSSWTDAMVVTGETGWAANELRTFAVF